MDFLRIDIVSRNFGGNTVMQNFHLGLERASSSRLWIPLVDAFNCPAAPPPRGGAVAVHFAPADGPILDQPPAIAAQ